VQSHSKTQEEWMEHQYRVESTYAQQILASPKDSKARAQLFRQGYDEITRIFGKYNPGGGETSYADLVAKLIRRRLQKGARIFDLGCAGGSLLHELATLGYEIEGIDVSADLIQKARERLGPLSRSQSVTHCDIMSYCPQKLHDCVVMDNVIEHFHPDTIDDILGKCHAMLKERGYIIILTPHRFSGPHDISRYFIPLGSKAKGFHLKEFSFGDLHGHLKNAGFRTVLGFPFHPRLLRRFNLVPDCSEWAREKTLYLESLFDDTTLSSLLTLNTTVSRILVALLFPAVCVARK